MSETEWKFDAFVSYSRTQKEAVEYIINSLQNDYGLVIWVDSQIEAGAVWMDRISKAIDQSSGAVIFISGELSAVQNDEIQYIYSRRSQGYSIDVIPVLLPGATDEHFRQIGLLGTLQRVDLRRGLPDLPKLSQIANTLKEAAPSTNPSTESQTNGFPQL